MQGKTTCNAMVPAAEVSMKKAVRVQDNDEFPLFFHLIFGAEGAGGVKNVVFQLAVW